MHIEREVTPKNERKDSPANIAHPKIEEKIKVEPKKSEAEDTQVWDYVAGDSEKEEDLSLPK
jgi:hypothetical protein